MECQKIINLLDDTTNQPSKFRTINWVEINDESRGKYDNSHIKFKTSMIRSNLCDYSDAYILVKGTTTVPNTAAAAATVNSTNKKVIFKNCAPFTNCITEIYYTQIDEAQDIDIVMPMYNLIEYSDACSKTSGSLWQQYTHEPALHANNNITDFPADNNNSTSFKFKQKITGQTGNGGRKDAEIVVPLKCLINFWRIFEMSLINCEISLQLKQFKDCILVAGTAAHQNPEFKITDAKLYVLVLTLLLFKQLESGFKRTISWNKYLSKTTNRAQNRYLGINRLFVLSFKFEDGRAILIILIRQYYLSTV